MARLPILHKRRSRREQALDTVQSAAKTIITLRLASRAVMGGAKAAGKAKRTGSKLPSAKLLMVPAAVGGGVLAWRKLTGHHDHAHAHSNGGESSVGPVSTASAVSPPMASAPEGGASEAVSAAPTFANETT